MDASIYIHVPFCSNACDYCDFYSITTKPGDSRHEHFITTLLLEGERLLKMFPFNTDEICDLPERDMLRIGYPVQQRRNAPESVQAGGTEDPLIIKTVFMGGGTPSVLGPEGIGRLLNGLSGLYDRFSSSHPVEITLEANPETIDDAFLTAIRDGGITRLSIGIQTFHGLSRRAVNRIGDETLLSRQLDLAQQYFPGAFSVDLMSGLPYQDDKILLNDIAGVLSHQPAHVSLYALTTKLKIPLSAPDQDEADRLWICGRDALEKAGYKQYEVSNFCLEGKQSLHNIRYWHMHNWIGMGPAASGTFIDDKRGSGFRYTIPADVDTWLASKGSCFSKKQKCSAKIEILDTLTLIKESILMGFRYIEGPDEDLFRLRFHLDIKDLIPKTIGAWRERGSFQEDKMALTRDGILFLNRFLLDAFEELDAVFSSW